MTILILASCSAAGVPSTSPTAVFAEAGLLGTWSPDCSQPPSASNPRVTWRLDGGTVDHTVSFDGVTVALHDYVGTAELLGSGQLRLTAIREGRLALTATVVVQDGRVHTLRSVGADGHVYYDHGIELKTGKSALWDERCAAALS